MTVLEHERRSTAAKPRQAAPAPEAPAPRQARFARYFRRSGWIHALLLLSVWLFLFPFIWMLATSVKTDEELTDSSSVLPAFLTFRPNSPYVRKVPTPSKPTDVTNARWEEVLPHLRELASAAIGKYQAARAPQPALGPFDPAEHRAAAALVLVNNAVGRLDRRLWTGPEQDLYQQFSDLLTDTSVASALSDSLARFELLGFQLRTLDLHIFNITDGPDFARSWRVESGPGKLFQTGETTLLSYNFPSSSSEPVVLRCDFRLPPGVKPADLHKLLLSTGCDNSWHRVNLSLDMEGQRWTSDEPVYMAQFRAQSLIFQPPTFDDELMRAKVWTSIHDIGPVPAADAAAEAQPTSAGQGIPATLRITLTPSNTLIANWGKVLRNYDRAFKSVPFWRYITNSVLLVVLCTAGSLFSAAFVGYAFARLHWPGRSVAFIILLGTIMLPSQVTMIPGFMVWRYLHWYNTLNPLWVPSFFGSAFFVYLMTQHMRTIPRDLEEAARIDGLNAVQSWYYIILPNVTPTLAAISILSFMGSWNEFMGPLIYLRDQSKFPLSLGLYGLGLLRVDSGADYSWSVVMAGNVLMTVPVILVFFLFQRYFVESMTMTGMKG